MTISITVFLEVIVLLGGLAGIYVTMITRVTRLEAKMQHVESSVEKEMQKVNDKLDDLQAEFTQVRLALENKANRS